jgi:hypothetical protein
LSWQVRARRISLSKTSNTKGSISQAENIWPRFDAESTQSPSFPGKREKEDFVSFRKEGTENPDFTPLEEPISERTIRKSAEEILKEAQSKTAFLEREAYEKDSRREKKMAASWARKKSSNR